MNKSTRWLGALTVVVAVGLAVPSAQKRATAKGPVDFKTTHTEIGVAFAAGNYGSCLRKARELTTVITDAFETKVLASMPPAPAGYTAVPRPAKKKKGAMESAMMASMMGAGNMLQQKYKPTEKGKREVTLTVTSNSPLMSMFSMWVSNPMLAGPDAEVIEYNQCKALLKKEGRNVTLSVKIGEAMVDVKTTDRDGDFLLGLLSQAHLDKLQKALQE